MAADRGTGRNSCGEEALLVLKENIYKYNSREEKERLDKLGQRLSEERLLSNASIRELIDLHVRYNDGESLDSIVASIKHPGMLLSHHPTLTHCTITSFDRIDVIINDSYFLHMKYPIPDVLRAHLE